MPWLQNYDPLHGPLSTLAAALPLVVLLGLLASRLVPAHVAALSGLATALMVAVAVIGMPPALGARAAMLGAAYGMLPIGWIVLNVIFLYRITEERGVFVALQRAIAGITADRRLQLLLIAFAFGAFFEGAAGFGTPVAVTGAMLIGLGFPPLEASALSLIANTAPVAFGALGTPIIALQGVTGLDLGSLSAMVGRQLPFFSVIVPFWLIAAYAGFRGMLEVWPALLVAGLSFAIPQFLVSNYHGPWLVDIVASACSMLALAVFLRYWRRGRFEREGAAAAPLATEAERAAPPLRVALIPWIVLVIVVFAWGTPQVKSFLNHISSPNIPIAGLDKMVQRAGGGGAVHAQLAVGDRDGDPHRGDHRGIRAPLLGDRPRSPLPDDVPRGMALAAHDRRDACSRLHDAVLRRGRDPRTGLRAHGRGVSVFRGDARLAWRRAHRERYVVERSVREFAEDHGD